ncbi:MAG: hypothetical protein K0R31_1424, partial [Clostridiales bacterium]|nr:hypothetical protein [Clostridiales bacterium]
VERLKFALSGIQTAPSIPGVFLPLFEIALFTAIALPKRSELLDTAIF